MNELFKIIIDTYSQTVEDNKRDFISVYGKISKLCLYLFKKGLLNEKELEDILNTDNVDFLEGDSNE